MVNLILFGLNYGIEFLFMVVVGGVLYVWGVVFGVVILIVL